MIHPWLGYQSLCRRCDPRSAGVRGAWRGGFCRIGGYGVGCVLRSRARMGENRCQVKPPRQLPAGGAKGAFHGGFALASYACDSFAQPGKRHDAGFRLAWRLV